MPIPAAKAQTTEHIINNLLVTMGVKVDDTVSRAIAALLRTDSHVVAGVLESSVAIQDLALALEQAVFAELQKGDLDAVEIRRATSAVKISRDLSRLSKLAANLGHKVTEVGKHQEHEDFSRLQPLAIAVSHLCRQTLRSLTRLDPVVARNAAEGGATVDAYRNYVLQGLSAKKPHVADDQNLHLIFASRCLEQIADNAIHVAENVVIFLDGQNHQENTQRMAS